MSDEVKKSWIMRIQGLDRFARSGDNVRDKCDIMSFSHGIYADPPMSGSPRRVQLYDVSIVRETDAATPLLMRLCQTGDTLQQVTVEMRAEKDGKEIYRLVYELLNARISRLHPGGGIHGPDYRPVEDIGLSFEKLRIHVKEGEQQGSAELTPTSP
ncbi:MAG: type VI secretion system tube protein Hcp [Planctomycetes bacterium]|nr:type VI secretion system tube protein Hcp [Planctomycetota bacterium]